ncbi:hypothetical protein [Xanthomonas sacchari]|uniref:hypothetical protein n=1 Tax=Xanthomonas sacchari TaxID=56458 RepID=UPI0035296425
MAANLERVSAEGALRGVLDQPSAVVERFFWLLFFAQAKKSDPRQRKLLLLIQSFMLQIEAPERVPPQLHRKAWQGT